MSEMAKKLFDGLKSVRDVALAIMPGLKNLVPDAKAEFARLETQARSELAGALFNGHGYVPYGPGQYTPAPEQQAEHQADHQPEQQHEMERER